MLRFLLFRKWTMLCALFALAFTAGLLFRARAGAGESAEVIFTQPMHAEHAMQQVRGASIAAQDSRAFPYASSTGRARVEVPENFFDFGTIRVSAVAQRDFLVINRGDAPLVIHRAYTTCGCTTAELTASAIPPGMASRVTVTFDASIHPIAGQTFRRGLVMETNDPDHPLVEIWVQATIEK